MDATEIILVTQNNSKPTECPNCHKPEDVKQVCKHCEYIYPEENTTWWDVVKIIILVVVVMILASFLLISLAEWLEHGDHKSLIKIMWENLQYLFSLKVF